MLEGAGGTGMIERIGRRKIVARFQLVHKDNLRRAHVVIASEGFQRFSGNHFVKPPLISLVHGDFGDALLIEIFAAGRQMQLEGSIAGSAHPQQAGIKVGDLLHRASTRSETRRRSTL